MSATSENKRNFTFVWVIKNYSFDIQKENEYIQATFIAKSLNNTQWYLNLYPKGSLNSDEGYIACYLQRAEDDHPANILLDFRLEIIGANDESVLAVYDSRPRVFEKGSEFGWHNFKKVDFVAKNRNMLLSDDVFTVKCFMEEVDTEKTPATFCRAVSEISVDRFNFKWLIKDFNSSDCDFKTSFFSGRTQIGMAFHVEEDDVNITISNNCGNNPTPLLVKCKVTLLDVYGFETDSEQSEHLFEKEEDWEFPKFLKKSKLLEEESRFLKEGVLAFRCEFSISDGTVAADVEEYRQDISEVGGFVRNTAAFVSLKNDLRRMFASQNLADAKLICGNETYPCHKSILFERSKVFSAKFERAILENNISVVEVKDLDSCTLHSMLLYIYTGSLEEANYETVVKLLRAAYTYQVTCLEQECVAFLRSVLSERTVCEILSLADTVGHDDLKSSAMDYIKCHWRRIFHSNEWNQLIKINFRVATEAFRNLSCDAATGKLLMFKDDDLSFESVVAI